MENNLQDYCRAPDKEYPDEYTFLFLKKNNKNKRNTGWGHSLETLLMSTHNI